MSLAEHPVLDDDWLNRNELSLPENLGFSEWSSIGTILKKVEKNAQWWLGDWVNYGERNYGDMYAQAMEETGRSNQTLRNCAFVARSFELYRRRYNLSWSHHQTVASLPLEEQEKWLDLAESEDFSRGELRGRIRNKAPEEAIVSLTRSKADALEAEAGEARRLRQENSELRGRLKLKEQGKGVLEVAPFESAEAHLRALVKGYAPADKKAEFERAWGPL